MRGWSDCLEVGLGLDVLLHVLLPGLQLHLGAGAHEPAENDFGELHGNHNEGEECEVEEEDEDESANDTSNGEEGGGHDGPCGSRVSIFSLYTLFFSRG